ncbi:MAG: B12-binding domain-containing radical SAM protein, partial [Bdellovibrionales bacterium]|nr:B12-binding domain-containing radical SAM protein [Bdellovibrionales bacterium]
RPPVCFSKASLVLNIAPPLGLAYIAGTLKSLNYRYNVIDSISMGFEEYGHTKEKDIYYRGLSTKDIISRIPATTNLLFVSCMFANDWNHTREIVKEIKSIRNDLKIIAGGETVSALPDYILEDCPELDYICIGEGERFVANFCHRFFGDLDVRETGGLAYRENGVVKVNGERKRIIEVDEIPWPDWESFNIENYLNNSISFGMDNGRVMPFNASRGCAYRCSFCSSPNMWGTRYIPRDPQDIIKELSYYKERYKVDSVEFHDLTLFMKKSWMNEFLKKMVAQKLNLSWTITIGTRVEGFTEENIKLLKMAGCTYLTFAPESGSNETLKYVEKRLKIERIYEKIKLVIDNQILTKINVIIGFPDETRVGIWKSLWMIIKCAYLGVNDISISIFYPYPGSKFFDELVAKDELKLNRSYFSSLYSNEYFKVKKHYCRNVGDLELTFYSFFALASFYALSYIFHPMKLFKFLKGIRQKKFETRLEKFLVGHRKANVGGFRVKLLRNE